MQLVAGVDAAVLALLILVIVKSNNPEKLQAKSIK